MQNENGRLKIHTNVRPMKEDGERRTPEKAEEQELRTEAEPIPERRVRTKRFARTRREAKECAERLTVGERLLRNAAVSCALLLTVMALRNVDQPWSRQATEGVRQAMTMRVDWDETLGKLSFVRALVPDAALVFLNMDVRADLCTPVNGEMAHEYTEQQPWIEYRCPADETAFAAFTGTVTAVGQGASGDWTVLIEREDGDEAVYGYLADVCVRVGQQIEAGDPVGNTENQENGRMYFEFREDGQATDPSARMK